MPDDVFIFWLFSNYSASIPQWKRVTKKEYEKHCGKDDGTFTISNLEKYIGNIFQGIEYRKTPYYNDGGGGILDQISHKEPSGYYYEKCIGYNKCLLLGGELIEYCRKRDCVKHLLQFT
jgi:hypothetical protein